MKKIVSLTLSLIMVLSVLACSFISVSAAVGITFEDRGSITLDKFVPTKDGTEPTEKVSGATFTAYRVFNLVQNSGTSESTDEGTFKVTDPFKDVPGINDVIVKSPVATGNQNSQGGLFTNTDDVEKLIPALVTASKAVVVNGTDENPATVDGNNKAIGKEFTESTTEVQKEDGSTETVGTGTYTVSGLPLGVYLVVETSAPDNYVISTASFLVSIPEWVAETKAENDEIIPAHWNYAITAMPKDDPMTIEKEVKDSHKSNADSTVYANEDSYNIGEKVEYKVTSKIPDYGKSTLKDKQLTDAITDTQYAAIDYTYADTFSTGLTFNYDDTDDMVIYIKPKDTTKSNIPLTSATDTQTVNDLKARGDATNNASKPDFKVTKTANGFTVKVAWEALNNNQGDELVLEYSATLNKDAVIGAVNNNKIELTYTNNPETGTTDVIEDDADVATYELHLDKLFNNKTVDNYKAETSNSNFDPTAVTFKIATDNNDSYLKVNKISNGKYYVWDTENNTDNSAPKNQFSQNTAQNGTAVEEMNVDSNGKLVLTGLKAGTYYLEETKTIDGYGKLKNKVKVEITTATDEQQNTVIYDCDAQSYTNEGTVLAKLPKFKVDKEDQAGTFVITVNNTKNQFNLPTTGGLGLWLFTIAGGIVMAGGIIFFSVIRKKKKTQ
ncbi:MAG: SpaA isopeptide-forming pilin-related protein [Acutalibacteraceae bacterium]